MLVAARIIYALSSSGIQPAASAFVADTTEGAGRTQGLALVGAAAGVGTAAGPVLGASLVGFGVLVPLYAAAVLALAMGTSALIFLKEPPAHVRSTPKNRLRILDQRIWPYLLFTLLLLTAAAGTYQTAAFYVQDRLGTGTAATAQLVGWAMGATAIVTILTQGLVVQWLKPAPAVLVRVGLLIGTAAFIFLTYTKTYEGLVLGYMFMGAGIGLLNPGLLSAASLSVGPDEQGAVAGLVGSAMSAGFIFGPALGAGLYEYGQIVPLQVNAVIMGVMLIGSLFLAFGPRNVEPTRYSGGSV
jgi:predicted MFS family arabinose efflux permease